MLTRSRGANLQWREWHLINSLHNGTFYAKYAAMMILFDGTSIHTNRLGTVICRDPRCLHLKKCCRFELH